MWGYRTPKLWDSEHNKACLGAKIVVGHTGFAHIALANSVRDFKVLGAGGFLLTEHVQEIETLFEPGVHCDTYRTADECADKIRYYLNNEAKRTAIAAAGYEHVHQQHRYVDRIQQVLEDVRAYKKQSSNPSLK